MGNEARRCLLKNGETYFGLTLHRCWELVREYIPAQNGQATPEHSAVTAPVRAGIHQTACALWVAAGYDFTLFRLLARAGLSAPSFAPDMLLRLYLMERQPKASWHVCSVSAGVALVGTTAHL